IPMAVLSLRYFGDPVLRTPASEVASDFSSDAALGTLLAAMLETMDHSGGGGLAANQFRATKRASVYDCECDRGHAVNPTWESVGEETQTGPEGCLSIPGIRGEVQRAATVRLRGQTLDGELVDREVSGLLARCVQHETDHLDGVLFLKHLSPEDRKQ